MSECDCGCNEFCRNTTTTTLARRIAPSKYQFTGSRSAPSSRTGAYIWRCVRCGNVPDLPLRRVLDATAPTEG